MIVYVNKADTFKRCLPYFLKQKVVGLDTEWGKDDMFHSIQISTKDDKFYVIEYRNISSEERAKLRPLLQEFLISSTIKILHFSKNDILQFLKNDYEIKNTYCTYIAEKILTGNQYNIAGYYSLNGLLKRYCGYEIVEKQSTRLEIYEKGIFNRESLLYAAMDVESLIYIYKTQMEALCKLKMARKRDPLSLNTLIGLECLNSHVFAEMEYNGIEVDLVKLQQTGDVLEKKKENIKQECYKLLGKEINLNSSKQKLEELRKIVPDIPNTRADTLIKYKDSGKLLQLLVEYNKYAKLISAYVKGISKRIKSDGRVHAEVDQIKTTGRIGIRNPSLQNIPARTEEGRLIRSCFVAKEGYSFVDADYSNMELRIVADLSKEQTWINAFKEGKNLHDTVCINLFKIPLEDIRKPTTFNPDITYRGLTKNINFGIIYGAGAGKISKMLQRPMEVGKKIVGDYYLSAPKLEKFVEGSGNYGIKYRFSKTRNYNRRRFYSKKKYLKTNIKEDIRRQAKNAPVQGQSADMTKKALAELFLYQRNNLILYPREDVKFVLQVHDSIVYEVKDSLIEDWMKIQKELMESAANSLSEDVHMAVDIKATKFLTK